MSRITTIGIVLCFFVITFSCVVSDIFQRRHQADYDSNIEAGGRLSKLAQAMREFHEKYRQFPPTEIGDEQGAALLSWRVLLLPYLGEHALYREFKLDEPWDGPNNKKLLPRMPDIYRLPRSPPSVTTTHYLVIVGEDTVFDRKRS